MNKLLITVGLAWLLARTASAQSTPTTVEVDYLSLVNAERTFAAYTEQEGIKAGFFRFLAPTALVIVQKKFASGKPLYEKSAFIPGCLSWWPVYADIAASGDFGYTTGPFEVRPKGKTDTPVAFGHFTTVWQKNSSGVWEVLIDVGIQHDRPVPSVADLVTPASFHQKHTADVDTTERRSELIEAENQLAQRAGGQSLQVAYQYALAKEFPVRLYRASRIPSVGLEAVTVAKLETIPAEYTLTGVKIASSGDMGFSYGYVVYEQKAGAFLRIWKRWPDSSWKVVHEVLDL